MDDNGICQRQREPTNHPKWLLGPVGKGEYTPLIVGAVLPCASFEAELWSATHTTFRRMAAQHDDVDNRMADEIGTLFLNKVLNAKFGLWASTNIQQLHAFNCRMHGQLVRCWVGFEPTFIGLN